MQKFRTLSAVVLAAALVGACGGGEGARPVAAADGESTTTEGEASPLSVPEVEPGTILATLEGDKILGLLEGGVIHTTWRREEIQKPILHDPEGNLLAWFEGRDQDAEMSARPAGRYVYEVANAGGGGLDAGEIELRSLDPLTGEQRWAVPLDTERVDDAFGNSRHVVISTPESDAGYRVYTHDGTKLPDLEIGHLEDVQEEGAVDDLEDVIVDLDTRKVIRPYDINEIYDRNTLPDRSAIKVGDARVYRATPDGREMWSVPGDVFSVEAYNEDIALVSGETGDWVVLDSATGEQLRIIPKAALGGLECSGYGGIVSSNRAVLTCGTSGDPDDYRPVLMAI